MTNKKEKRNRESSQGVSKKPGADVAPGGEQAPPAQDHPMQDEQAEKYIRKSGIIEDVPDADDQKEAERIMREEKKKDTP